MEITADALRNTATRLTSKDFAQGKVLTAAWKPNLQYAWDDGVAIGRYLKGLKDGRLLAKTCRKCNRVMIPPRMFCEQCWRTSDDWVTVKDTGTVNTFAISHVDWAAKRLIAPDAADDLDVVRLDPLAASSPVAALASPQLVVDQIGIDFNAGGVSVSGLEMTQNSQRLNWTREEVDNRLKLIMNNIHRNCLETSQQFGVPGNYMVGANIAGFIKVVDAMIDQGIV